MNEHLEPVFKILLPRLEKAGIDYWVYGGVAIAAFAGKFIRINDDVDIFVKETDFQKAKLVLDALCNQNGYKLKDCTPLERTQRPKLDIKINKVERLSVAPAYLKDNIVEFRFWKDSEEYPYRVLEKIERNISGCKFFTPPDEYIKKLFMNYLTSRSDKKNKPKIKIDAKAIFTADEFAKLYPSNR